MAIKMKGIFKGLKIISQMFDTYSFAVHKEHEMEIGYPTDVKHVAHIGLGTSDTSPRWTAEFKGTDDSSAGSVRSTAAQSRQTSWTSAGDSFQLSAHNHTGSTSNRLRL
ncbi:CRIB domain-containing protein RIC10 [Zea mays]|uniref:CRIB domain-containing protein RIC10 n=2 Tax=Zea mays TaxID=4577 RepID=A0A1D6GGF6_MAIZE|nr:CRIB domain-containing protein RIC10 [Zea mays]